MRAIGLNLLLATSIVTLAVLIPLNSVILANTSELVCVSCLVTVYITSIIVVALGLQLCQVVRRGVLYGAGLKTLLVISLVIVLHVVEITMIPKAWRLVYDVFSFLGVALLIMSLWRGRIDTVRTALLFVLVISAYEAWNFMHIAASAHSVVSYSTPASASVQVAPLPKAQKSLPHIFLIIFDEFPLIQVLDGQRLDPEVVPHLAAFSKQSTWFPQAVTSHDSTDWAIPALLTANLAVKRFAQEFLEGSEGATSEHLFSITSQTHDIYLKGFALDYCSAFRAYVRACQIDPLGFSNYSLLLDSWWVRAVPGVLRGRFTDWLIRDSVHRLIGTPAYMVPNAASALSTALELGQDFQRPTFTYAHVALPHRPYVFGPDGEIQRDPARGSSWIADAKQHFQDQIRFTDGLLGEFLGRLKARKVYEGSLIIVTSDHGISFESGHEGRGNGWIDDGVAGVPLLIKLPDQTEGRIDDRPASIVDVFPTVNEILGAASLRGDGVSLLAERWDPRRPLVVYSITCDRQRCPPGHQHPKFVKTDRGWALTVTQYSIIQKGTSS